MDTSSLFVFFFILLWLVFASFSIVYGTTNDQYSDKDSLLAFKSHISNDPLRIFDSWNESVHFCNWSGVTCGRLYPNRVTELDLGSKKLEGILSPHIGNLSFLEILSLQNNSFRQEIPQQLGALFRLQVLYLNNNSFSGGIPVNLSRCSNLKFLNLSVNHLNGELPSELGGLSQLQDLRLNINNFVGKIPPSFGNLSSLRHVGGSYNNFYGSIPSTLGQLKNLDFISFGANNLSGQIPKSLYNLSTLTCLSFGKNKLSGNLPFDIGLTLPKLQFLLLHTNQMTGPIPMSIANITFLILFEIGINRFTGNVPDLGSLQYLSTLLVSANELGNGENSDLNFMTSLLNCTSLKDLSLDDNKFGGMMPEFLSNFSKLTRLKLGKNKIRGRIPSDIGNLVNLDTLDMQENLLTGGIPSSVTTLRKLYLLYLGGNKLSGEIPSSIGNISTSLTELHLGRNNLRGSIPPSIGECIHLQLVNLSQNSLSGTIPKELLSISSLSIYLDLSDNILTGSLPSEVGLLVNLEYLNISENKLSGEIPPTLSSCTSLEKLSMEGNHFHGTILSSLESLRGLQVLDLSRNQLSGHVPSYLEKFSILKLNLSWNDFEGQLPSQGVFSNFTAISVTGNNKLCGGIPQLNLQSCTPTKSKPSTKSKLKLIVSLVGVIVGMIVVSLCIYFYITRRKKQSSAETISQTLESSIPKVTYNDLLNATDGFSSFNLIGEGGFGSVYKGYFNHEKLVVAVKVLNLAKKGATKSFMAECEALRCLRHRNLVRIITACSIIDFKGNDFKALVYELMINGSLEDWLHVNESNNERKYLSFVQRFNIIVDVANALDYMHNECQTPIAHCDIKPSNILIDENMVARVSDFGLARLCAATINQLASAQSSSLGIKGSIGYAAPEYGLGSEISICGDVYSFGILLLETFLGKRPTDNMFEDGLDLHKFALITLPERVMSIADPRQFQSPEEFPGDKFSDCFLSIVKLGVACSVKSPRERINIKMVVEELGHIRNHLLEAGVDIVEHEGRLSTFELKTIY